MYGWCFLFFSFGNCLTQFSSNPPYFLQALIFELPAVCCDGKQHIENRRKAPFSPCRASIRTFDVWMDLRVCFVYVYRCTDNSSMNVNGVLSVGSVGCSTVSSVDVSVNGELTVLDVAAGSSTKYHIHFNESTLLISGAQYAAQIRCVFDNSTHCVFQTRAYFSIHSLRARCLYECRTKKKILFGKNSEKKTTNTF